MKIFLSGDVDWESRADVVRSELARVDENPFFAGKSYGSQVREVAMILVCHNKTLNIKQRVRLDRRNKILYLDVLLDFEAMKNSSQEGRRRIVATRIISEVTRVALKYKGDDFDADNLIKDFQGWIESTGWLA
jgi:hypothetical protein